MLRFARLVGDWAEVRTGGSLLADSDPPREEEETRLKAEIDVPRAGRPIAARAGRAAARRGLADRAPAPRRVRFVDGDALAALARESLVQAGCSFADDAAITVLGDAPLRRWRARAIATTARRWR